MSDAASPAPDADPPATPREARPPREPRATRSPLPSDPASPTLPSPEDPPRALRPIGRLTYHAIWLTWVVVAMDVIGALQIAGGADATLRFNTSVEYLPAWTPVAVLAALVAAAIAIAQVVVAVLWMQRAGHNAAARLPGGRWLGGWTIGAWFVPYGYLVLGWLVIRDIWNGTFGASWRTIRTPVWLLAGFLLWSVPQGILHAIDIVHGAFSIGYPTRPAPAIGPFDPATVGLIDALLFTMAAIFFVRFLREVADAHERYGALPDA